MKNSDYAFITHHGATARREAGLCRSDRVHHWSVLHRDVSWVGLDGRPVQMIYDLTPHTV